MSNSEFVTRSMTGFMIVVITLAAIIYSPWSYLGWLCIIVFLGAHEYLRMERIPLSSLLVSGFPLLLALTVGYIGYGMMEQKDPMLFLALLMVFIAILFMLQLMLEKEPVELVLSNKALYSCIGYIGLPAMLGCVFLIGEYSWQAVLVPVVLIWLNDAGAYLIGSKWGKHKVAPSISPGKSWEGTLGGGVITLLAGWVLITIWPELPVGYVVAVSISTPFFALAGDMWESALKRQAGVKDSGNILPGHGGILDRYDSLLFVLPVAALAYFIFA